MVENQFGGGGENKRKRKEKEREKKRKNKKEGECVRVRGKRDDERRKKKGTPLPFALLGLTEGRNSSDQETKLVYVIQATRGYRNPNFSSKFQKVGVFSYTGFSLFKSCKWPCGSA